MAKFFDKILMESESVQSKVRSGKFQSDAEGINVYTYADIHDGAFVVLGDHVADTTYVNTGDINNNAYLLTAPANVTDKVAVVDIAGVAMAGDYKIGVRQYDLVGKAGELVRIRLLSERDQFEIGAGNFSTAPTVGKFGILDAGATTLAPASTVGSGFTVKILKESFFEPGQLTKGKKYLCEVVQL